MTDAEFSALAETLGERTHRLAFTVAGVTRADLIQSIHNEVAKALDEGGTLGEFRDGIDAVMERSGWAGVSPHRLDNIFRTNIQTSYNIGREKQQLAVAERRPYWEYDAVNDERTRPSHLAQDGKIYHHLHPFWKEWYPPNGYR